MAGLTRQSLHRVFSCALIASMFSAFTVAPMPAAARAKLIVVFPIRSRPILASTARATQKKVVSILASVSGYDARALSAPKSGTRGAAAASAGAEIYVVGQLLKSGNRYHLILASFDVATDMQIRRYDAVIPRPTSPASSEIAALVSAPAVAVTGEPMQPTPSPSPTPCDTSDGSQPNEPEGHWADDGPTTIVNTCSCVAQGIRVVGVHRGSVSPTYNFIPAVYLQIFNLSGERRSIWADVELRYPDGSGGWHQTPVWTLRGDQREGFGLIDASPTLTANHGSVQVVTVNVLGCGK